MTSLAERLEHHRIAWQDGFLGDDDCRAIVDELDFALWRPSTVMTRAADGEFITHRSPRRTSESAAAYWFTDELRARLAIIEATICRDLNIDPARLESWQGLRYGYRAGFKRHHDAGLFVADPEGERTTTLLLFLHTPDDGGRTWFPRLNLSIAAQAGRLLVWHNLNDDATPDPTMEHAGRPVRKGRKIALTTWVRERPPLSTATP